MTLSCCVPFCRNTTDREGFDEWLCGDHWKLVTHDARRAYGRYAGQWRRYGRRAAGPAAWRLWCGLRRRAIQAAAGIG